MSSFKLGQRYERLLILAAPLTLGSLLVWFISTALGAQDDLTEARCLEQGARVIDSRANFLTVVWPGAAKGTRNAILYRDALNDSFRLASTDDRCRARLLDEVGRDLRRPDVLAADMRKHAVSLRSKPLSFQGVDLPDKATLSLFGTVIKIEISTLTRALQVLLGPLIMLWLGSIYTTRYRETLLIGSARYVSDIFPHVINVYPAMSFAPMRRKSWFMHRLPGLVRLIYACTRMVMILVIIGPTLATYIASLYLLDDEGYRLFFLPMGIVLCTFSLNVVIMEFLPWHYTKVFPGPLINGQNN